MKGHIETGAKALGVFLVSAALAAAQVNGLSASPTQSQAANNANYSTQKPAVGPGAVNYVEGNVSLNGRTLNSRSVGEAVLGAGSQLSTQDGYTEVLLTPGAFLRVGNNSDVQMLSSGLANTQVELTRGTALVEVDQLIKGTGLGVNLNGASARIDKKGLYAFNADDGQVRVLDGKTTVENDGRSKTIGKHDQISLTGEQAWKKQSFDEDAVKAQPLYVWSKARSQDMAEANMSFASNSAAYSTAGPGWYWDPYLSAYGFWPIAGSMYSPFGFGFYSPAYFGGFYGGGYYGGGYYGRPGYWHGHGYGYGWRGRPGPARVGGVNARVGGFSRGASGFHGGGVTRGGVGGAIGHGGGGHR